MVGANRHRVALLSSASPSANPASKGRGRPPSCHSTPAAFAAALFDQQSDEHRIADWGGDELFTRMPRPRVVDDAPAPRFRPSLRARRPARRARRGPAPSAPPRSPAAEPPRAHGRGRRRPARGRRARRVRRAATRSLACRATRAGRRPTPAPSRSSDGRARPSGSAATQRHHRPTRTPRRGRCRSSRAERRRPPPHAGRVGRRAPERIVAWAFVLGLLLILDRDLHRRRRDACERPPGDAALAPPRRPAPACAPVRALALSLERRPTF